MSGLELAVKSFFALWCLVAAFALLVLVVVICRRGRTCKGAYWETLVVVIVALPFVGVLVTGLYVAWRYLMKLWGF